MCATVHAKHVRSFQLARLTFMCNLRAASGGWAIYWAPTQTNCPRDPASWTRGIQVYPNPKQPHSGAAACAPASGCRVMQ